MHMAMVEADVRVEIIWEKYTGGSGRLAADVLGSMH
jgi:hypothetical protein